MSCWVVPAVAAEYWGVSVTQVLERVRTGSIPSKTEFGFMLVDVAPNSPRVESGFRPPAARPHTYVKAPSDELTEEEQEALGTDEAPAKQPTRAKEPVHSEPDHPVPVAASRSDPDEPFDWRGARVAAGRQRRAPRPTSLAA